MGLVLALSGTGFNFPTTVWSTKRGTEYRELRAGAEEKRRWAGTGWPTFAGGEQEASSLLKTEMVPSWPAPASHSGQPFGAHTYLVTTFCAGQGGGSFSTFLTSERVKDFFLETYLKMLFLF